MILLTFLLTAMSREVSPLLAPGSLFAQSAAPASPPTEHRPSEATDAASDVAVAPDSMAEDLTSGEMGQIIRRFTYVAIIGVLLLCGMGLPLPEEVPILTSGVLARMGHLSAWPALIAVLLGVMAGDSVMFLLGRRWGTHLLEHRLSRRMLTAERQARIAEYFDQYGAGIIFVARFLPGVRAPLFLTAGSMRVTFWKFFSMDGLAALLSVPLSFGVAYYFTDRLKEVLAISHTALYWLLGVLAIALLVGHLLWDRWRSAKRRAKASGGVSEEGVVVAADASETPAHTAGRPATGDDDDVPG